MLTAAGVQTASCCKPALWMCDEMHAPRPLLIEQPACGVQEAHGPWAQQTCRRSWDETASCAPRALEKEVVVAGRVTVSDGWVATNSTIPRVTGSCLLRDHTIGASSTSLDLKQGLPRRPLARETPAVGGMQRRPKGGLCKVVTSSISNFSFFCYARCTLLDASYRLRTNPGHNSQD